MGALTGPVLEISRSRFLENIAAVRRHITPSALMLVMKDDAYGHGLGWATDAACAALGRHDSFGAYDVATALRIRGSAPEAAVFAWVTSSDEEIARALAARIDLGVGTAEYLRRVIAASDAFGTPARVHLKIDTGLHRNGIRSEDWAEVVAEAVAAERAGLIRVAGVWTHLAEASDADDDVSAAEFHEASEQLRAAGTTPQWAHVTASAASWWRPELRGNLCRVGAFCYGIRSAEGPEIPGVLPVASLYAPVVAVDGDEAIIATGALHGLPSTLVGARVGTPRGPRTITRVDAVTMTVVDASGLRPGDTATVFGPGEAGEGDATSLAEHIGTVGEEILTRLTTGVRRVGVK